MRRYIATLALAGAMTVVSVPVALADGPIDESEHAIQDQVQGAHRHHAYETVDQGTRVLDNRIEADDGLEHAIQDRVPGTHASRIH